MVLKNKLIKFAENSREITLKAYSLGRASYLELLQSEMKLQEFLLKETNLVSALALSKVDYKYLVGESLNE